MDADELGGIRALVGIGPAPDRRPSGRHRVEVSRSRVVKWVMAATSRNCTPSLVRNGTRRENGDGAVWSVAARRSSIAVRSPRGRIHAQALDTIQRALEARGATALSR